MADRASGLPDRLNRISHWDVNVTDLERSSAWYEATTTLRVVARTKASQSFPSFGIEFGSFTGYLLKDATLPHGVAMLHLVQWEKPAPVGTPYRSQANVGWYRIVPIVADLDAAREVLKRSRWAQDYPILMGGIEEWDFGPPWGVRRVLNCKDPEGVAFQLIEQRVSPLGVLHPYGRGTELG